MFREPPVYFIGEEQLDSVSPDFSSFYIFIITLLVGEKKENYG